MIFLIQHHIQQCLLSNFVLKSNLDTKLLFLLSILHIIQTLKYQYFIFIYLLVLLQVLNGFTSELGGVNRVHCIQFSLRSLIHIIWK